LAADLHLHTTESDGTWTPKEVVQKAFEHSLRIIAITDHDTTQGIAEAKKHAPAGLEVISGIELSTLSAQGEEIHILGYWIDENNAGLQELLEKSRRDRITRAESIVEKLNNLGLWISYGDVEQFGHGRVVSRSHIASALESRGYVQTKKEAFEKYLAPQAPAYVARHKLNPAQAVKSILKANGVPVLAHPGLIKDLAVLPALVDAGLAGLEVVHSSHDQKQVDFFLQLAAQWQLTPTGGSDCHGPGGKDEVFLGKFTIPQSWVDRLARRR